MPISQFFNKRTSLILILILFLGLALRLINLGIEPFWGDEILSLDIVKHYQDNLADLINYLNWVEVHPPLYYLLLFYWAKFFGWHEFGVRLLSLVFGLGIILLVYSLSLTLFKNKKISLLAAFLTAVLPFQIEFSQEARPYIIFCFFGLVATIVFWRYVQSKKTKFLILYILTNIIGLYLHYSYLFFLAALASYWFLICLSKYKHPSLADELYKWFLAHSIIYLLYLYQLKIFFYKIFLSQQTLFNTQRVYRFSGIGHPVAFFEDVLNQLIWFSKNAPITVFEGVGILIFKITSIVLFVYLFRQLFIRPANYKAFIFVIYLIIVPIVFFFFSPYSEPYSKTFERHIIITSAFIPLALAYLINLLTYKKQLLLVSLFLISLLNSIVLTVGDDSLWDKYHIIKLVDEHINLNYQPGDLVLVDYAFFRSDVNHYLNKNISSHALYPVVLLDYNLDFLSSRETLGLNENEKQFRASYMEFWRRPASYEQINLKMSYLVKKYKPKRIWFYNNIESLNIDDWFANHGWRLKMDALGPLHPLKLFAKN